MVSFYNIFLNQNKMKTATFISFIASIALVDRVSSTQWKEDTKVRAAWDLSYLQTNQISALHDGQMTGARYTWLSRGPTRKDCAGSLQFEIIQGARGNKRVIFQSPVGAVKSKGETILRFNSNIILDAYRADPTNNYFSLRVLSKHEKCKKVYSSSFQNQKTGVFSAKEVTGNDVKRLLEQYQQKLPTFKDFAERNPEARGVVEEFLGTLQELAAVYTGRQRAGFASIGRNQGNFDEDSEDEVDAIEEEENDGALQAAGPRRHNIQYDGSTSIQQRAPLRQQSTLRQRNPLVNLQGRYDWEQTQ